MCCVDMCLRFGMAWCLHVCARIQRVVWRSVCRAAAPRRVLGLRVGAIGSASISAARRHTAATRAAAVTRAPKGGRRRADADSAEPAPRPAGIAPRPRQQGRADWAPGGGTRGHGPQRARGGCGGGGARVQVRRAPSLRTENPTPRGQGTGASCSSGEWRLPKSKTGRRQNAAFYTCRLVTRSTPTRACGPTRPPRRTTTGHEDTQQNAGFNMARHRSHVPTQRQTRKRQDATQKTQGRSRRSRVGRERRCQRGRRRP